jgi:hypothetical protein
MGTELVLLGGLMMRSLELDKGYSNGREIFEPADLLTFLGLHVAFVGSALELGLSWSGEFYPPDADTR